MFETNSSYHTPVLLDASIEGLNIRKDGVYIDATYGGGGHSKEILKKLGPEGRLYVFDQDKEALANRITDFRCIAVHANFQYLTPFMKYYGVTEIDGLLADLGVSSHHFDRAERGFSFRYDAPLDMRMNQLVARTAADILNQYSVKDLQRIFSDYGEVRNAKSLSQEIVERRKQTELRTIADLMQLLDRMSRGDRNRYYAQVFQALRIELNDEMNTLKKMLEQALDLLRPGGRLVVISYHSVEDRIVKDFFRNGNHSGKPKTNSYGQVIECVRQFEKRPQVPEEEEIRLNPRARSAKLRIAEKI